MLDIFSRKAICWEAHYGESGDLAKAFMQHAIAANGGARPHYIHADNGTSMTSKNVATLLTDLNITRSHSRPHVSNDNPFSEAAFKTFKYCPVFPGTFAALEDARAFSDLFFTYYNNEHRHSGIGLHTPASVHDGTAWAIQARRQLVLDGAFAARPDRFRGRRPLAPPCQPRYGSTSPASPSRPRRPVRVIQLPNVSISLTGSVMPPSLRRLVRVINPPSLVPRTLWPNSV